MSDLRALLSTHEQELRRLYTSLGSPDSVVQEKLADLHRALIGTVEQQRRDAEDEVAGVKRELEALKGELKQLAVVLGCKLAADPVTESLVVVLANRRKALATLNDLRKERLDEFQQLYAQLQQLRPILGDDFFDTDLEVPIETSTCSLDARNLTLIRQKLLQSELERCQRAVCERTEQLEEQTTDLALLYDELEIEAPPESTPLFPVDENATVPPTREHLQLVSNLLQNLDSERQSREARIQQIYDSLFALWLKMEIPENYMEEFVETYAGISSACISAYETEYARMLQVKNENMQLWIRKEREELRQLKVDLFLIGPDDIQEDDDDDFDRDDGDALLEQIALEKAQLVQEAETKRPILLLIAKYRELLAEIQQLEASANDPSRLTGRGVRGDPGRLLREEKQRKRIAKERPKLESELLRLLPEWEAANGQYFLLNGARYLDDLHERMSDKRARAKTPAPSTRAPSVVPSSVRSNPLASSTSSKRAREVSRPASPSKRIRPDNPAILANGTNLIRTMPVSKLPASKIAYTGLGKTQKPRASFRPRPSSVSSFAPSSMFSGSRTVSTAATSVSERDGC